TMLPENATGPHAGRVPQVLSRAPATPSAHDTDHTDLSLEDVAERPYRLDRMLTQLRQAGAFERVAGLVFGTMAACPPVDGVGPLDVVRACVGDLPCPIAFGLPSGHAPGGARAENLALPFRVEVAPG